VAGFCRPPGGAGGTDRCRRAARPAASPSPGRGRPYGSRAGREGQPRCRSRFSEASSWRSPSTTIARRSSRTGERPGSPRRRAPGGGAARAAPTSPRSPWSPPRRGQPPPRRRRACRTACCTVAGRRRWRAASTRSHGRDLLPTLGTGAVPDEVTLLAQEALVFNLYCAVARGHGGPAQRADLRPRRGGSAEAALRFESTPCDGRPASSLRLAP
jgi:hypothetical protein